MPTTGIDPRSPRFGAGITAVLLLVVVALALAAPLDPTVGGRLAEPDFILFAVISAVFAWGAFGGIRRHPYGVVFRHLIRPRLAPPAELEDPTPPTFAQGVGFVITLVGLGLHVVGVPLAIVVAASAAFVAAFLNSAFGYCLGCQIYLALSRTGIIGKRGASEASSA